jgi:hypothetical protein
MKTALWMALALTVAQSGAHAQNKLPTRLGTAATAPAAPPSGASAAWAAWVAAPAPAQTPLPAATAAAAPAQEHERQLQAIRQALLEATIDRPTRVIASAWVDDSGVLHESAHFHSQAEVQGVRVLSYIQGDEPAVAKVDAQVLPWGLRPNKTADGSCQSPPRAWRLPMTLQTRLDGGFSGAQQHASQWLLKATSQYWSERLSESKRWQGQESARPASNTYSQLLSGSDEASAGWVAELSLSPQPAPEDQTQPWTQRMPWVAPAWRWSLNLTVGRRTAPEQPIQPLWTARQTVSIPIADIHNQPTAVLSKLQQALERKVGDWIQTLEQDKQCDPLQFAVLRQAGSQLMLQAGQGSGLRPGDRVLLMNPAHVPSRVLEPGATQHLALAEVVRIGRHQTELQQLAGPALPAHGQWVALPL